MTDVAVVDEPENRRFAAYVDGSVAELIYRVHGDRLILVHTEVPGELAGRGLAGALVRAALDRARMDELTVVPWCPFAREWLQNHEDEAATVEVDWDSQPPD